MKFITPPILSQLAHSNKSAPQDLINLIGDQHALIENWFVKQWCSTPPPLYASTDLRYAGFKIAPVDTNLFPAGFNNLASLNPAIQAIKTYLNTVDKNCQHILLIPEDNTRNLFYLENIFTLQRLLSAAGYRVQIGSLDETLREAKPIQLASGHSFLLNPIQRHKNRLIVGGIEPSIIILNNDLSAGLPPLLNDITQLILPAVKMGWYNRLKSNHFTYYQKITQVFAELLNLDPWFISPLFSSCEIHDLQVSYQRETLALAVDELIQAITLKYQKYQITAKPFVFIKSDSGTYGRGIITAQSNQDILHMNRKQRNNMAVEKGRKKIKRVIIQEGIYSQEMNSQGSVAEPVIYMVGNTVVGGFYRVHQKKGAQDNLNSPGMHFEPFNLLTEEPYKFNTPSASQTYFYLYTVIARLALLAAAQEMQDTLLGSL